MEHNFKNPDIIPDNVLYPNAYYYQGNNKTLTLIFNFSPRSIQFCELNPIYNPKISATAILISLFLDKYYRHRYFLIRAETLRLFSLGVNYFTLYYMIVNSIRFYEYYDNRKAIQIQQANV